MLNSSAIEIMRTFSPEELKRFRDFILSPYFNKIKNIVKFFSAINKYAPEFNDAGLEKEKVWKKIFPGKEYNYGIMKNLIYELNKLLEIYLRETYFRNDIYFEKALIRELAKRQLNDLLTKKFELFGKRLDSEKIKDEEYISCKIFLNEEIRSFDYNYKLFGMNKQGSVNLTIEQFLLNLFERSLEYYVVGSSHNVDLDKELLDQICEFFINKVTFLKDIPVLYIYSLLLQCYKNDFNEKYYFETKKYLNANLDNISFSDKKNIYFVLNNICNKLFLKGRKEFYTELYYNYLEMFRNNIYSATADGKMSLVLYRNFVNICVHLKKVDTLIEFAKDFKDKVLSSNKTAIDLYSDAYILLARNEFNECLGICSRIPYNDFFESVSDNIGFKSDIRIITLRCLYELDMTEEAISAIDSNKHFIKNNDSFNEQTKNIYYTYFGFMKDLVLLKSNFNLKKLEELKYKVLKEGNVYHKDFFLEKINSLATKKK